MPKIPSTKRSHNGSFENISFEDFDPAEITGDALITTDKSLPHERQDVRDDGLATPHDEQTTV